MWTNQKAVFALHARRLVCFLLAIQCARCAEGDRSPAVRRHLIASPLGTRIAEIFENDRDRRSRLAVRRPQSSTQSSGRQEDRDPPALPIDGVLSCPIRLLALATERGPVKNGGKNSSQAFELQDLDRRAAEELRALEQTLDAA